MIVQGRWSRLRCKLGLHTRTEWKRAPYRVRRAIVSTWTCSRCGRTGVAVLPLRHRR